MDRRSLLRRAAAGIVLAACGSTAGTVGATTRAPSATPGGTKTNTPTSSTAKATKATVELTKGGSFTFTLRPDKAPQTVERFAGKSRSGFYNNLKFHRVEDWVVQGGDPLGTGTGGARVPSEYNDLNFAIGAVGIARGQDPAFNNDSQWFICKKDASFLDKQYTNFGMVTSGMDVVQGIKIGDTIKTITIESMLTTRGTVALLVAFTAFVAVALPLDRGTDAVQQSVLGLSAWAFLAVALALQPRDVRVQVLVLVAIATLLEVFGSIVWGAYRYRLENLPLYVPAGHGLFYLCALRAAALPIVRRNGKAIVVAVTIAASAYMLRNLAAPPLPDLLGFVTWAIFIRFIARGTAPVLYAVSFVMTSALELYGTALGIWTWSPVLPVLMLPAANPPSGIGAGYAAMDALTRRIVKRIRERSAPITGARRAGVTG